MRSVPRRIETIIGRAEPYLITDTGPLVALMDLRDKNRERCQQYLSAQPSGGSSRLLMLTTWACLTEAAYLLKREGGHELCQGLDTLIERNFLQIYQPSDVSKEVREIFKLMDKYADAPMDIADASLVLAAETLSTTRIFTLDSHFYAYRTASGESFEVIP